MIGPIGMMQYLIHRIRKSESCHGMNVDKHECHEHVYKYLDYHLPISRSISKRKCSCLLKPRSNG